MANTIAPPVPRIVPRPNTFVFARRVLEYRHAFYAVCPECHHVAAVCFDNDAMREQAYSKIVARNWQCVECERSSDEADHAYLAAQEPRLEAV